MAIFGPDYLTKGTFILQILALSCIPWVLEAIFLAVARAKDWLPAIMGIQWVNLGLVLVFGLIWVPEMGGAGMALAWLLAHTVSVVVIVTGSVLTFGAGRALNTAIVLVGEILQVFAGLFRHAIGARSVHTAIDWRDMPSDGQLTGPVEYHEQLDVALSKLRVTPHLADLTDIFPEANKLPQGGDGHARRLIPDAVSDGSALIENTGTWSLHFADAVDAIAQIHAVTARTQSPSATWMQNWITDPLAQLGQIKRVRDSSRVASALVLLETHMRDFWSRQELDLGLTHCRLSPASLVFDPVDGKSPSRLRKIIGWSAMRADGPAGFDICQLALTLRMRVRAQDLGPIVHDLLGGGGWSENERRCFASDRVPDKWLNEQTLMREMIILAWVNHLAQDMASNPAMTSDRFWRRINLDWPLSQAKRYVMTK